MLWPAAAADYGGGSPCIDPPYTVISNDTPMAFTPIKREIVDPALGAGEGATLVPDGLRRERSLELYVANAAGVGRRYDLPAIGALSIGRSAECSIVVDDPMVSRRHAVLHVGESLL